MKTLYIRNKLLFIFIIFIFYSNTLIGQEIDTLSIEINEKIQSDAFKEFRGINDSIALLRTNLINAQIELEMLKAQIQNDNLDRQTVNDNIDKQIIELKKLQHTSFNNLKVVLNRMSSASDVTDDLAKTWIGGISLSQNVSNPFSNSVIRNKWDKYANTAKWLPFFLSTGYSFATEQSVENKVGTIAIGVAITGIVDIIQNISRKDGVHTAQKVIEQGGEAIEVISIYRAGYDDLNEIVNYLNSYLNFMTDESTEFKKWYDDLEKNKVFTMTESEIVDSPYWVETTFENAQLHLEKNQRRLDYYYNVFTRVDLLINSKMSNQLFSKYAIPGSPPDNLEFVEDSAEMLKELYSNLSTLRKSLKENKNNWENLRKRYYTLRQSELEAITSWVTLKKDIRQLELAKK